MRKGNKHIVQNNSFTEILLYTTSGGKVKVEIFLRNENIWLTQDKIAILFGVQRPAITKQLARVRDIRSSERRFYQKITDIYSQCSADYDSNNEVTNQFFASVQNKLHWAISHQTAAEIIYNRADSQIVC